MRKVYSMFLRACLCVSLPVAMFSCSDSDDDPVTIPTNPNPTSTLINRYYFTCHAVAF